MKTETDYAEEAHKKITEIHHYKCKVCGNIIDSKFWDYSSRESHAISHLVKNSFSEIS